jgi:hypothetical protein
LPVSSVIAPPQLAQKQMPVSSVGPLTILGAITAGLRLLSSARTASNSAASMIGGTAISTTSASGLRSREGLCDRTRKRHPAQLRKRRAGHQA